LRLRFLFSAGSSSPSLSFPFLLFFAGIVVGGGIEVEAEAAVDRGTHDLSCRDVLEDASPTGTDSSAARMGTEASGGGAIEEVEADAAVD
jgi:hypothetical protein